MADYPTCLTIAGSDSGGGAGIQADLKTFLDHRVFGMSAICAITAQNTRGVTRVDPVPVEGVRAQLQAVFDDLPVGAVKIGMLGTAPVAAAVAEFLGGLRDRPPVVLDPVMIATTGARLLTEDAVAVIRDGLLPLATVATPNLPEAGVLAGAPPSDRERLIAWSRTAPCAMLLTGGDVEGPTVTDTLVTGDRIRDWTGPRVPIGNVHGTGCTLSSAIAARLARGEELEPAIDGAIAYVRRLVVAAAERTVGHGARVLPHGLL
jgi:hydroxymethylpyrimidine/phosphomethylpyrimidine kinase